MRVDVTDGDATLRCAAMFTPIFKPSRDPPHSATTALILSLSKGEGAWHGHRKSICAFAFHNDQLTYSI